MDKRDQNEDLFQQSIKGRGRLLRGMNKRTYESMWEFLGAYLLGILFLFIGLVLGGMVVGTIVQVESFSLGNLLLVFPFLLFVLFLALALKTFQGLIRSFKKQRWSGKIKFFIVCLIPTIIFGIIAADIGTVVWEYFFK